MFDAWKTAVQIMKSIKIEAKQFITADKSSARTNWLLFGSQTLTASPYDAQIHHKCIFMKLLRFSFFLFEKKWKNGKATTKCNDWNWPI